MNFENTIKIYLDSFVFFDHSMNALILFSFLIPLLCVLLLFLFRRFKFSNEIITVSTSIILFFIILHIFNQSLIQDISKFELINFYPGITLGFSIEPLGILFALLASFLWIINSIYSIGYMRSNTDQNQTIFYICFALSMFAVLGIAFSSNLFTFFLFYEALTLFTYPLVTHNKSSLAVRGGRIYLGVLLTTSICFLLFGIILIFQLSGTLDFTNGGVLPLTLSNLEVTFLVVLFLLGIGKAALFPFHFWLPSAMVAPTPVSAFLHAVAVVKAGVFGILKVAIYIFGLDYLAEYNIGNLITLMAGITIIYGSIKALKSNNLKERLAFSTVSQLSYVVIAASILTPIAITAAIFHLLAHAFGKITLFFAAGSIYTSLHKTEINELRGVGYQMPITMVCFSLAALSMIGLPPTAGFVSKWYLFSGAMLEEYWIIIVIISVSTLLNIAYFSPIIFTAFFQKPIEMESLNISKKSTKQFDHYKFYGNLEAPIPIIFAMITTVAGIFVLFIFPDLAVFTTNKILGAINE